VSSFWIVIVFLNVVLSILDMRSKPGKIFNVPVVTQKCVPRSTCDRFLGPLSRLEFFNKTEFSQLETELCHHLSVLSNDLLGLRKLEGFEEVGKIFINIKLFLGHGESPLEKEILWYEGCENNDEYACATHDEKW